MAFLYFIRSFLKASITHQKDNDNAYFDSVLFATYLQHVFRWVGGSSKSEVRVLDLDNLRRGKQRTDLSCLGGRGGELPTDNKQQHFHCFHKKDHKKDL